jgi:hypothetical protein
MMTPGCSTSMPTKEEQLKEALPSPRRCGIDDRDGRPLHLRARACAAGLWRRARRAGRSMRLNPALPVGIAGSRTTGLRRRPVREAMPYFEKAIGLSPTTHSAGRFTHTGHFNLFLQKSSTAEQCTKVIASRIATNIRPPGSGIDTSIERTTCVLRRRALQRSRGSHRVSRVSGSSM